MSCLKVGQRDALDQLACYAWHHLCRAYQATSEAVTTDTNNRIRMKTVDPGTGEDV